MCVSRIFFNIVFPSLSDDNNFTCHTPTRYFASTNIFWVFQNHCAIQLHLCGLLSYLLPVILTFLCSQSLDTWQ